MRLVDADTLINDLEDMNSYVELGEEHPYYKGEANALSVVIGKIKDAPTVDVTPLKHGRWKFGHTENRWKHWKRWYCTVCDYEPAVFINTPYCPHCGAKLDEERQESND